MDPRTFDTDTLPVVWVFAVIHLNLNIKSEGRKI